jgi:hypothetical protein
MSPIQGSFSDHYCRKKSLIFALFAVIAAQSLILAGVSVSGSSAVSATTFFLLLCGFLIDGIFGNVATIARAALVDSAFLGSIRKALGYSFALIGLPWILIFSVKLPLEAVIAITLALNLIALALVSYKFSDNRDEKAIHPFTLKNEVSSFLKIFKSAPFVIGVLAFLVSEIGFEFIFLYETDIVQDGQMAFIYPLFGLGFSCGSLFQSFVSISLKNMKGIILLGFAASFVSILINPIFFYFQGESDLSSIDWARGASILATTSGFYFPSIFALFSHYFKTHQQGKIFGFLESTLNLGEMIVTGLFFLLGSRLSQNAVILFSSSAYLVAYLIFRFLFK